MVNADYLASAGANVAIVSTRAPMAEQVAKTISDELSFWSNTGSVGSSVIP